MGLTSLVGLVVCTAALCYGDGWSSPLDVFSGLRGNGPLAMVVRDWRLPRVTGAVVFGAALGLSGAVFQNVTRNPLGTPDVIGMDQGAYFGVLLVLTMGSGTAVTGLESGGGVRLALASLVGGLVAAAIVLVAAAGPRVSGLRLIVVGIAVNAVLTAGNSWLILRAELDVAIAATSWSAGSLNGLDWDELLVPGVVVAVLALTLVPVVRPMHQLSLGDDVAAASGIDPRTVRIVLVMIGVALTAVVVAATGPIVFVALAAPQIGRRLAGVPGVALVPAAVCGGVLLVAADLVAQFIVAPVMLPVGIVTSAIGGLYLLWLLLREIR
jgi:iron complex transport system permease protein